MTSFLTRLPRTTFQHIASFLSLAAKESLSQLCSAVRHEIHQLSPLCYRHDAIALDLTYHCEPSLDTAEGRKRASRLTALLPHVASIAFIGYNPACNIDDLVPSLKEGLVSALKGRWLIDFYLGEDYEGLDDLTAVLFGALAEREEDSPLLYLHWSILARSLKWNAPKVSLSLLCPALVRCTRLTCLDIDGWRGAEEEMRQLLPTLPVSLKQLQFRPIPEYDLPHEQLLIDAFHSPSFLPNLTSLQSWHAKWDQGWAIRALPVIAACPINDVGNRRPIQHLQMDISADMFPSLAQLTQIAYLDMRQLSDGVDWVALAAAFPSFLPRLQTVLLQPPAFPSSKALESLLQFLSPRPVRDVIVATRWGTRCPPLTKMAWAALAALQSMQTLTIHHPTSRVRSRALVTRPAYLRLLSAGGWPALLHLDLTAFTLSLAELKAVIRAAPRLSSIKLKVQPACAAVCIPIIGQHCRELQGLEVGNVHSERRVTVDQLLRALNSHSPSATPLLPRLERLRVFVLDDAAVHLLLHRLRASPLQCIYVSQCSTLWQNEFLMVVLCRCPRLRVLDIPSGRRDSRVINVLTQPDVTSPTGFRFLQDMRPCGRGLELAVVLCEDSDSRAALCTALEALLTVEQRETLQRWDRQEATIEDHKADERDGGTAEESKETVTRKRAADTAGGLPRRSRRRRGQ